MKSKHIIVSVVLHAVVVYLLIEKTEIIQPRKTQNFLSFKDAASFPAVNKEPSPSKSKRNGIQGRGKSKENLQTLLRQPIVDLSVADGGSDNAALLADGSLGGEEHFKEVIELPRPLEQVWRQIRAHIHYHSDFFIGNIQGQVVAKILISETGKILSMNGITGHPDLVEWVKVAISNALSEGFLRHPLTQRLMLELKFIFAIVPTPPPVEEYVFQQKKLHFNIFGYRDPTMASTGSIKDLFKDKKMYRHSEWNFTKRLEPFHKACYVHKNPIGCEKLIEAFTRAGLHAEAQAVSSHLKQFTQ